MLGGRCTAPVVTEVSLATLSPLVAGKWGEGGQLSALNSPVSVRAACQVLEGKERKEGKTALAALEEAGHCLRYVCLSG